MSEARVVITPYDPRWPGAFEDERRLLESLALPGREGPIEHVGSTAVVGLAAKPVIDVMVGVASLHASSSAQRILEKSGYHYADYRADEMHWFCKPSPAFRTHHLHLVPFGGSLWTERLVFRDALRADAALAAEYAALKVELASKFADDREAYTKAKTPFVERVLARSIAI